jgi:putative ABC transport system permease protein
MLLLKTWRDLLARKGQFAGLVLVVALGISTYVAFLGGYLDLTASVDRANSDLRFADFTISVISAPRSVVDVVATTPGVLAAEGRLIVDTALDLADGTEATARVIGYPVGSEPSVNRLLLQQGRMPAAEDRDEALLHVKFATDIGAKVGDTLTLRVNGKERSLRIVGIVASPEYMYPVRRKGDIPAPREFAVVWVPQRDAERLFGRSGAINDVAVVAEPGADVSRTAGVVEKELEQYHVLESVQRKDQPSSFALASEIEQNRVMAVFMPLLILAISSSSLFIALSRLVTSQRGEIGLAKALGYTDGQVLAHYLLFGAVIAVLGSALGVALGDLMGRGIAAQYVTMLGIPFLEHHVYGSVVAEAVAISVAACFVAALGPAWRSARLAPAVAMHSDPNLAVKGGRIPLLERWFGWAMPRTFTFRIPLRNVFRVRRRSAYTILGIAFALVLAVATVASFDSIDVLIVKVFAFSERWDLLAVYDQPFGAARVAEVARWNGVTDAHGALMLPAEMRSAKATHEGLVTAMEPTADFHGFDMKDGVSASEALGSGGMVLAEALAKKLGVGVGDAVSVKTPYRKERVQVRIAGIAAETLGAPAFISSAEARELIGTSATQFNALYLTAAAGGHAGEALKDKLYDLPGAISVNMKTGMKERLTEMMAFTYFYEGILLAFGFAMAFVVIYNTFTANVLERTREIATMRTIGETDARLAVMVTIENLMLALVGLPLGVWLGVLAAEALYAQFSSEAYSFTVTIRATSVAWVTVCLFVVALLSEIPPVRRIFNLDLAEATKVME